MKKPSLHSQACHKRVKTPIQIPWQCFSYLQRYVPTRIHTNRFPILLWYPCPMYPTPCQNPMLDFKTMEGHCIWKGHVFSCYEVWNFHGPPMNLTRKCLAGWNYTYHPCFIQATTHRFNHALKCLIIFFIQGSQVPLHSKTNQQKRTRPGKQFQNHAYSVWKK